MSSRRSTQTLEKLRTLGYKLATRMMFNAVQGTPDDHVSINCQRYVSSPIVSADLKSRMTGACRNLPGTGWQLVKSSNCFD